MASSAGVRGREASNTVFEACPSRLLSCASALKAPPTVSGELACASPFGSAGSCLSVNKRSLEIATGVTSPWVMMTRTPSLVMPHIWRANAPGRRMQPCDAGGLGTTPSGMATPDQGMRCLKYIGALLEVLEWGQRSFLMTLKPPV